MFTDPWGSGVPTESQLEWFEVGPSRSSRLAWFWNNLKHVSQPQWQIIIKVRYKLIWKHYHRSQPGVQRCFTANLLPGISCPTRGIIGGRTRGGVPTKRASNGVEEAGEDLIMVRLSQCQFLGLYCSQWFYMKLRLLEEGKRMTVITFDHPRLTLHWIYGDTRIYVRTLRTYLPTYIHA